MASTCEICETELQEANSWHSWMRGHHEGPTYLVCTGCGWRLVAFVDGDVPAPYRDVRPGARWPWRDRTVKPKIEAEASAARSA